MSSVGGPGRGREGGQSEMNGGVDAVEVLRRRDRVKKAYYKSDPDAGVVQIDGPDPLRSVGGFFGRQPSAGGGR